jgi:hypothetical protein
MSIHKLHAKTNRVIPIDEDFEIEIDLRSWNAWQRKEIQVGKNKGKRKWECLGYSRDLPAALMRIMKEKAVLDAPVSSIERYLSWYTDTITQMCKTALGHSEEIIFAKEHNGVIVSSNNFVD